MMQPPLPTTTKIGLSDDELGAIGVDNSGEMYAMTITFLMT